MVDVTGKTSDKINDLLSPLIVSGEITSEGHLILYSRDGASVNVGAVGTDASQIQYVVDNSMVDLSNTLIQAQNDIDEANKKISDISTTLPAIQGSLGVVSSSLVQAFVLLHDSLTSEQLAMALGDEAIKVHYSLTVPWPDTSTQPDSYVADIWCKTNSDEIYFWSGTNWTPVTDEAIVAALTSAIYVQATDDSIISAYWTSTQPTLTSHPDLDEGDLWFDTDDDDRPYYISNLLPLTWSSVQSSTIPSLQSSIDTLNNVTLPELNADLTQARTDLDQVIDTTIPGLESQIASASGSGNKIKIATSPPTASSPGNPGDYWFVESDTNSDGIQEVTGQYVCTAGTNTSSGNVWLQQQLTNAVIASLDAAKISTGTLDAARIAAGSITTDHMTVNTINGDRIQTNTLAADRIVANTITTQQIQAGSILTSDLKITNLTNLIYNGGFEDAAVTGKSPGYTLPTGGSIVSALSPVAGGTKMAQLTSAGANRDLVFDYIGVVPGETYYAEFQIRKSTTGTTGTIALLGGMQLDTGTVTNNAFKKNDGTAGDQSALAISTFAQSTWVKVSGTITIPASTNRMSLTIRLNSDIPTGQTLSIDNVILRKAVDASLIVDGTINGNKIIANTITANSLAVNLDFSAKTITGGTINGGYINGGTIYGTNISGVTVTSGTVQTAASGPRVSISLNDNARYVNGATMSLWPENSNYDPALVRINGNDVQVVAPRSSAFPQVGYLDLGAGSSNGMVTLSSSGAELYLSDFVALGYASIGIGYPELRITSSQVGVSGGPLVSSSQIQANSGLYLPSGSGITASGGIATVGLTVSSGATSINASGGFSISSAGSNWTVGSLVASTVTSANVMGFSGSGSTIIQRNSSGSKYKVDVHYLEENPNRIGSPILDIDPVLYRDRHYVDNYLSNQDGETGEPRFWIGWTAEQFIDAGWNDLVDRHHETGEPESLMYDRVLPALIPELRSRFEALESENADLKKTIASFEARFKALETA